MSNLYLWSPLLQHVKNINKHAVLDLIRFTAGGISRVELAQRLDVSRAAMTAIVNDLIETGIIREAESRNGNNGRPPIILEINPERGWVLGIDMGATHLTIILTNLAAQVIDENETDFDISDGPKNCIAQVNKLVGEMLERNGLSVAEILAIGVDVPGPILAEAGAVIAPPIMPGWDGFPIRDTLEKLWDCPVSLNNDAELGALGEWAYGAGRGERDMAYIKVGTGIGAGLLLEGQIYRGATGSAGEIGHLTVDENGPLCNCGNHGCLEALAGGQAIARQAHEAIAKNQRTLLTSMGNGHGLSAREVASAARKGDLVAQRIVAQAGSHLGVAIAGLVNLFNPGLIVVGGGIAEIGDLFLQPVRDTVQRRSLPAAARNVKITTAVLGRRSSSMGAVVQALSIALHQVAERKEVRRTSTAP
jgi:glucokinase-like ROK family protein